MYKASLQCLVTYADLLLHSQNFGAKVFLGGAKAFLEESDINAPFSLPSPSPFGINFL